MIGGQGIPIAIGEVKKVFYRDTIAVFLTVALRHYQTDDRTDEGSALEADVRWAPSYHGPDYGDWHIPDIGADVICVFPGPSMDGTVGDDLDNGYAFAYASNKVEPPVKTGLAGDLSPTRRVYRGKDGVAHDIHFRGNHDHQVDGDETTRVKGNESRTIEGNEVRAVDGDETVTITGKETRTVNGDATKTTEGWDAVVLKATSTREVWGSETWLSKGIFAWTLEKAATILANLALSITSNTTLTLKGDVELKLESDAKVTIDGNALVDLIGAAIHAGDGGAVQKLCNEAFLALFNSHKHNVTGSPPIAAFQATVGVDTTTVLEAE